MSDFNLRLSFGAHFLPTDSYPHVYLNARSLSVLRSIASLCRHYSDHITRTCVSMRYAARWITTALLAHVVAAGKSFVASSALRKPSRPRIGRANFSAPGYVMKTSIVDARIPPTGWGHRLVSAVYVAVRYGVHRSDRSNAVSLRCEAEGGRRRIAGRWRPPTCRVGTSH